MNDDLELAIAATGGRARTHRWTLALVVWALACTIGLGALGAYAASPGEADVVPSRWPIASALCLDRTRATLVAFVHPECACSRASLDELQRVIERARGRVAPIVLVADVGGTDAAGSELAERARRIAPVAIDDGREAALFGARTSGHVVLYGPDGRLRFHGGVTIARGHVGESAATRALATAIDGVVPAPISAEVFGCGLGDEEGTP